MSEPNERRIFLHTVAKGALGSLLVPLAFGLLGCNVYWSNNQKESESGREKNGFDDLPEGLKPVHENLGTPKKLNYFHSVERARRSYPRQVGINTSCATCGNYTVINGTRYGRCTLIPEAEGVVVEGGWCTSWKERV